MTLAYETIRERTFLFHLVHKQLHRIDGPASIWEDGEMRWRQYNMLHRTDGPARILGNTYSFYIRGMYVTDI